MVLHQMRYGSLQNILMIDRMKGISISNEISLEYLAMALEHYISRPTCRLSGVSHDSDDEESTEMEALVKIR